MKKLGKYIHEKTCREETLYKTENEPIFFFYYKSKKIHRIDVSEFNSGEWKKP